MAIGRSQKKWRIIRSDAEYADEMKILLQII